MFHKHDWAWFNKACSYAMQGDIERAIDSLQQAIKLEPNQWREVAKTDLNFAEIRLNERFQQLVWLAVGPDN